LNTEYNALEFIEQETESEKKLKLHKRLEPKKSIITEFAAC